MRVISEPSSVIYSLHKTVFQFRILNFTDIVSLFILGTLSVEEVYKDRDQFAALVREVAAPDVGRMGIEILSFTIKDVYDDVQYLASLGKAQTAAVKRDADVGVAEANRDAGIRVIFLSLHLNSVRLSIFYLNLLINN